MGFAGTDDPDEPAAAAHDVSTAAADAESAGSTAGWTERAAFPVAAFAALLVIFATWAIGMPLFASPDEPAHLFKAYGTAHGEGIGTEIPGFQPTIRLFDVPDEMSVPAGPTLSCYFGLPEVSAACAQNAGGQAASTAAVLPPFWYAVVGGGARLIGSDTSQRAYRMVNATLCAAVFAAAFTIARRSPQRRMTPLLLMVLTPVTAMLSGTVHPNGFEIAAFAVVWMLALHAGSKRAPTGWGGLLLGGLFAAVLLSRFAAALWVVTVTALVAFTVGGERLRTFLNRRFVIALAATVGAAVVLLGLWSRWAGVSVNDPRHASDWTRWHVVTYTWGAIPEIALQVVGRLGWLDTRLPTATYVLYAGFIALLVTGVLLSGSRRLITALILLGAAFVALPIVVNVISAPTAGLIYQGRYSVPLVIGAGYLGMLGWGHFLGARGGVNGDRIAAAVRITACVLFVAVEVLGFWQMLRRFTVGAHGKVWLSAPLDWSPSIAPLTLIGANALAAVCLCVVVGAGTRSRVTRRR